MYTRPTARPAVQALDADARNLLDSLVNDLVEFQWGHPTVGPTDLAQFVLLALAPYPPRLEDARRHPDGTDVFDLVRDGNGFQTRFTVRDLPTT